MKERVRFAVGAASMVLAACCLMGALFTAWLRCAAGAVTQAAGWAVMQQLDLKEQPWAAGTGLRRRPLPGIEPRLAVRSPPGGGEAGQLTGQ